MAQAETIAKSLHEYQATVMGQVLVAERKTQCSQAFGHTLRLPIAILGAMTQTSLLVHFVSDRQNTTLSPIDGLFHLRREWFHAFLRLNG